MPGTIKLEGTAIQIGSEAFITQMMPIVEEVVRAMRAATTGHEQTKSVAQFWAGIISGAVGAASADIGPEAVGALLTKLAETAGRLEALTSGKAH